MQVRPWIPLLLTLAVAGCGAGKKMTGPETGSLALRSAADAAGADAAMDPSGKGPGAVYVMTNAPAGNAVLAFTRNADGRLEGPTAYPTGGTGTGAGLGNQSGLTLGDGKRWLFTVNAASNDISVFRVGHNGLELVERAGSGGQRPVSLTVSRDLLYVLNAGGDGNIQGFRIHRSGALTLVPGSNLPLSSAAAAAAQIGFTPDGQRLVVTERATNRLSIYEVAPNGSASGPVAQASSGATPFGFGFDKKRTLIVSEAFGGAANASAVSSYRIGHSGPLALVSASVPTLQTAACWIAVDDDGRFAYTTNTGSGTITGYSVGHDGTLARLDASGVSAPAGAGPIDAAFSNGSRYLYVLSGGAHTVGAYAVGADGSLSPLGPIGGLPAGANGLAAR